MHVLLTGASGQLGRALQRVYTNRADVQLTLWDLADHDVANPQSSYWVSDLAPDVVINAAAWTNVDGAESNPDAAYAANALAPKYLAEGCERCGALLVQISTNEVFPGAPGTFYREYDQPAAASVYARSKLAGERAAACMTDRLCIVRVAWLFTPGSNNFPSKIAAAADRLGALQVVDDEYGNPTYAPDAAAAIAEVIDTGRFGIYHLVNEGWCSRFDLAQCVLRASGRDQVLLTPISSRVWARTATPPPHAVLVNQAAAALDIKLRPWQEAVEAYCREVKHAVRVVS